MYKIKTERFELQEHCAMLLCFISKSFNALLLYVLSDLNVLILSQFWEKGKKMVNRLASDFRICPA